MKTKIIAMVTGVLLAIGVSAVPAAAHQYSAGTYWVCGYTKGTIPTVGHSWPQALRPGVVTVYCRSGGGAWQWLADWYENGTIVRVTPYQDCSEFTCGGPGGH